MLNRNFAQVIQSIKKLVHNHEQNDSKYLNVISPQQKATFLLSFYQNALHAVIFSVELRHLDQIGQVMDEFSLRDK